MSGADISCLYANCFAAQLNAPPSAQISAPCSDLPYQAGCDTIQDMESLCFPSTCKHSGQKSSRKHKQSRATGVPVGFHPLSEKMVDVLMAMQEKFVNLRNWWCEGAQMRALAAKYYQGVRQVLRESSPSVRWLARCCHCDIFFLPTRETGVEKICAVRSGAGKHGNESKAIAAARRTGVLRGVR